MTKPASKSGKHWPLMIVGLLGINVTVCAITVTAAVRTPMALEPEYYGKAMRWDEERAAWSTPESVGLAITTTLRAGVLEIRATDATTGIAVPIRDVRVEAFSHSADSERLFPPVRTIGEGVAGTALREATSGLWEVRVWANAKGVAVRTSSTIEADASLPPAQGNEPGTKSEDL